MRPPGCGCAVEADRVLASITEAIVAGQPDGLSRRDIEGFVERHRADLRSMVGEVLARRATRRAELGATRPAPPKPPGKVTTWVVEAVRPSAGRRR